MVSTWRCPVNSDANEVNYLCKTVPAIPESSALGGVRTECHRPCGNAHGGQLPQPTGPRPPAARLGIELQRAPVQPQHADATQPRGSRRAPQNGNGALCRPPGGPPALPAVQVRD